MPIWRNSGQQLLIPMSPSVPPTGKHDRLAGRLIVDTTPVTYRGVESGRANNGEHTAVGVVFASKSKICCP